MPTDFSSIVACLWLWMFFAIYFILSRIPPPGVMYRWSWSQHVLNWAVVFSVPISWIVVILKISKLAKDL